MRVLTLMEPLATLVAFGLKRIDTRSWPTRYRGPLAIHASKRFDPRQRRRAYFDEPFHTVLTEAGVLAPGGFDTGPDGFRPGHILAVTNLVDCFPTSDPELEALLDDPGYAHERAFGNYEAGRFGFPLQDTRRLLQPIRWSGGLGLRKAPPQLLLQLEAGFSRIE